MSSSQPSRVHWLRTPLAALGVALATISAALFVFLFGLESLGWPAGPYFGLVLFILLPTAFVFGLLLIPLGNYLYRRRGHAPEWPQVDLNNPRHQRIVLIGLLLTCVNLVIVGVSAYGGIRYMETASFCGQVCHPVMGPYYAAYQDAPHSKVACPACHVGEGAEALVRSKLSGLRQLGLLVTNRYARPVPSPVHSLRPARETCETCHWSEKFHGDKVRVIREYANDEANSETVTALTVHIGGGSARLGVGTGIHWHMNLSNEIEYIATDARRQMIPYVRLRTEDGTVREYRVAGVSDDELARGERRRMDCMDCHNRPSHPLAATPERAVDNALAIGRVNRDLPFVRREMLAALKAAEEDGAGALDRIAQHLQGFYRSGGDGGSGAPPAQVERAVSVTQDLYGRNVFPAMKIRWGTYTNELGHMDSPGCFRCHDDDHVTADGRAIGQDCEGCHAIE